MVKTVILALAAAPVSAEKLKTSRKVPPRHPLNRIARLQQFGFAYVEKYYPPVNGGNKGQGMKTLIESFTTRMQNSFSRAQCGHYDSNQKPHGGPDPNPEIRFWSEKNRARNPTNGRKRREANQWMFDTCNCELNGDSDCYDGLSDNQFEFYSDHTTELFCTDDEVDSGECSYLDASDCTWHGDSAIAVRRGNKRKISENPQKAIKQITTGIRKWAERYLNNCHGMRKAELPRQRAKNLYKKWLKKWEDLSA